MKKHFISFIHKPVLVTSVSLGIALVVFGVFEYNYLKKPISNSLANLESSSNINDNVLSASSTFEHASLSFLSSGRVESIKVKVGDKVKKGDVLATLDPESTLGAVTQAQASYSTAEANYNKLINGATASTLDIANTSVNTAEQNLDHILQNAYTQVDAVIRTDIDNLYVNPNLYSPQFQVSFFDASANATVNFTPANTSQRLDLGDQRSNIGKLLNTWKNLDSSDRTVLAQKTLANLNTVKSYLLDVSSGLNSITFDPKYQANMDKFKSNVAAARSAIDTLITSIQSSQQALVTAKASANSVITSARPEDISVAKAQMENALGALQIAQAAYNGRIIIAPADSVVTAVHINVGETAVANTSIIEISSLNN